MERIKLKRLIRFDQKPWMKKHLDKTIEKEQKQMQTLNHFFLKCFKVHIESKWGTKENEKDLEM